MAHQDYFVIDSDQERHYTVETLDDGRYAVVTPEGESLIVDAYTPEPGRLHLITQAQAHDVGARFEEEGAVIEIGAQRHTFDVLNARQKRMRAAGVGTSATGGPELKSPMAGKVVAVNVAPGDEVAQGDCVLIVEAMKMENDLKAHLAGTVASINVTSGQSVEVGDVLIVIQAHDPA